MDTTLFTFYQKPKHLPTQVFDEINSVLSQDFIRWLSFHPRIESQLSCWMCFLHDTGWCPINKIYLDFFASSEYSSLIDYFKKNNKACLTIIYYVKHCSELPEEWPGIDDIYNKFVEWIIKHG